VKSDEPHTRVRRNVLDLINSLHCPDARTISEITNLRKSYMHLDVSSLMIKAYMLGHHDGQRQK
jgi:hypothetical protein